MQTMSYGNSTVAIPPDLAADIRAQQFRKLPAFLRVFDATPGGCLNCGGEGRIWMQFAKGGPFPAPSGGADAWHYNAGWWRVESKFYPCPACESHQTRINYLFEQSGLELAEREWRLEFIEGMEGKGNALDNGRMVLSKCPRPDGWYAFFGPFGVGKSGVLRSLTAACCRAMVSARYVRAEDILREMRSTFGDASNVSEEQLLGQYGKYQVLAIDEVDRVSDTRWSRSALFSLLDMRYNRRAQLATLLATNCDPANMPAGFEYLQSRMRDGVRVEMGGADLRGCAQ